MASLAKAALQSAVINAGSNILAQGIKAYRAEKPFDLDIPTLLQFTTSAFILSPLTFLWLEGLEASFPGGTDEKDDKGHDEKDDKGQDDQGEKKKGKLNVTNTIVKILIDQVIGGAWMTVLYIVTLGALRGHDWEQIHGQLTHSFFPLLIAGFKLWPLVSVLNFTLVPADQRLLVGSFFGVVWAVYLSLVS